jgi:tetratricopeptide (TPR) repeat protein
VEVKRGARRRRAAPQPAPSPPRQSWLPALILLAGLIAYAGSFRGPFIFDDAATVAQNPQIRNAGNLAAVFSPPENTPVAGRPLVNLSLALNFAAGGLDVRGYHVVNLALHLVCALLVFALVRRSSNGNESLAAAVALIWTVHPLNSEVVAYVTQRTESLMAVCYLLTLYGSVRALDAKRPLKWQALAVAACAAGTACKETIATAPLAVLLYDRVFAFRSLREAFRVRGRFYGALASSWLLLAALVLSAGQTVSSGFGTAQTSSWTYLLNQTRMLTRYLQLSVWLGPLVLYYGWPRALGLTDVWLHGTAIILLLGVTAVALWRWPRAGFLGAWAFLTLAPSSSLIPIATEVGAERRMYLALAGLIALAVVALDWWAARYASRRRGAILLGVAVVLAIPLGIRTAARVEEYESSLTMARTVMERWPSPQAASLVGTELAAAGRRDEAIPYLREAARGYAPARYFLGSELLAAGRTDEGIAELGAFVRDEPSLLAARAAHGLLANAFAARQDFAAAVPHYREYLAAHAEDGNAWNALGIALLQSGNQAGAVDAFAGAVKAAPGNAGFQTNFARALLDAGRLDEAARIAQQAAAAGPSAAAHDILGRVLAARGNVAGARAELMKALEIDPGYVPARDAFTALGRR